MRLRNAQVIGVTLALLVGVLAIAGPLCLTPRCESMMKASSKTESVACAQDAGHHLSAACMGMRQATPVAATIGPTAPTVDLFALVPTGAVLPVVSAARAACAAPLDEPPRLVLDTSRLRI